MKGLAAANMAGRLAWGPLSDRLGRKLTYAIFGLSIPLCASIPTITRMIEASSTTPLYAFIGATSLVVSFYGAVFAVLPAYVADTFGQKHMGAIFGRILTALPVSALIGPSLLAHLRTRASVRAIEDLASQISPAQFQERFGASVEMLPQLIQSKAVTIPRLMELLPPGTFDPSVTLYDGTMYTMAGCLSVAFVTNLLIRPVSKKYFEKT